MAISRKNKFRVRLILVSVLATIGLLSITFLGSNVVRDLRLLNSAMSDNVQWTLSQAEVEFLEFEIQLERSARQARPDLGQIRQGFDIFYSRINTLTQAPVYAPLREVPEFSQHLTSIRKFLEDAVGIIDAQDDAMTAALPQLASAAYDVNSTVRQLSNSGLNFFALESDARRASVAATLVYLAVGVSVLLLLTFLFTIYLGFLNRQNVKRRREAIQSNSRMNVVISTALDAVIISDFKGIILDFNAAARQIFGYSQQEAIGSEMASLIIPDYRREAHDINMERIRNGGERFVVGKGRVKMDAKRANGEVFPVELAVQSEDTDEGEIFVTVLRDISHRVKAEKELIAARDKALSGEKAKTDFLATMSHEIRTPLNGLLGNLTLLKDTALDSKQTKYIENMDASGRLLMRHISEVLDITKYDAGKLKLEPIAMSVDALLQDIVDNQSGAAAANNTALAWAWAGDACGWILADKDRLQHILMNIIGNAVKFTREGHVLIEVEASPMAHDAADTFLKFVISDTGEGMTLDTQKHIFEDFVTGDASYDRAVGGTGLGLGIALRFIKAMGGKIDVASALGKGSQFTVQLPLTVTDPPEENIDPTEPQKEDTQAEIIRAGRILLVEDNEINRFVAREMLTVEGHHVTEAQNGKIAVELVEQEVFDLILMDISMPVMDGRAATRAIRALDHPGANTPIIALTANAMPEEQEAFLADGMNAILSKPLSREAMFALLSRFIGQSPEKEPSQPDFPPLDASHLKELSEVLGQSALVSIIHRFVSELDEALESFENKKPMDEVARLAHRIAGSAATLQLTSVREALNKIENAAKQRNQRNMIAGIADLKRLWVDAKVQLMSL